ncbi:MAG: subclass B1 metallo-beta-lactamase [Myxococcota bacterium]
MMPITWGAGVASMTGASMRAVGWVVVLALVVTAVGCAHAPRNRDHVRVELTELTPGVWIHTSHAQVTGFGRVPANGLVIDGPDGPLMVDTPWNDEQTINLIDWIHLEFGGPPKALLVTHAHGDRLGGLKAVRARGIPVYMTAETTTRAQADGWPKPDAVLNPSPATPWPKLSSGIEVFFPGHGHTPDNVVVWLEEAQVLFGGCAVKSGAADNLGNIADADLGSWSKAIRALEVRYPNVRHVVPGHGAPGGAELLERTSALLEQASR